MKKGLMCGLFILLILATMSVSSAATVYNVTSQTELMSAIWEAAGDDIIIEIKNDLIMSHVYLPINFSAGNITVNGNGYNITGRNMSSAMFWINGAAVEFNDMNITNSTANMANSKHVIEVYNGSAVIESCVFENNLIQSAVWADGRYGPVDVKINNTSFIKHGYNLVLATNGSVVEVKNSYVCGEGYGVMYVFSIQRGSDVLIENVTIIDTIVSQSYMMVYDSTFNITGLTIENADFFRMVPGLIWIRNSTGIIQNSYFGNNSFFACETDSDAVVGNIAAIYDSDVKIIQNTVFNSTSNNSGQSTVYSGNGNVTFAFNTMYPRLYDEAPINGNLLVYDSDAYEMYFGTNVPAMNGGYAKTIKLDISGQNQAIEQVTLEEYAIIMGSSSGSDLDATGSKRLRGDKIDLGAVESFYKRSVIDTIIDTITGDSSEDDDDNKMNSSGGVPTRPSLLMFIFGSDSIFEGMSNLLYYILNNYVEWDQPGISAFHQSIIDVLGLEP